MSIGALTGVRPADAGIASGLINTTQQIGGAVGVAAATTIATTFTSHYVDSHSRDQLRSAALALTHGFQIAFYVLAATSAVGAVLAAVLIDLSVRSRTRIRRRRVPGRSCFAVHPALP